MEHRFKVGDWVQVIAENEHVPVGTIGRVTRLKRNSPDYVIEDKDETTWYCFEHTLELITPTSTALTDAECLRRAADLCHAAGMCGTAQGNRDLADRLDPPRVDVLRAMKLAHSALCSSDQENMPITRGLAAAIAQLEREAKA